ncbi:MAG: adenylyltransferase/cytidyltransferase family protein [Anaerolineae bacterium]|nr:adenylyltransferase/cytidyltransferase family protein [Anaerolineae bacterium]
MNNVVVTGSFDHIRSPDVRFLQEASTLGALHVLLWSDAVVQALTGKAPTFPEAERRYFLEAVRYVDRLTLVTDPPAPDALPDIAGLTPNAWVVRESDANASKQAFCAAHNIIYRILTAADLVGFPLPAENAYEQPTARKKVLVTGCYDWFHTGHVRFFEEVSGLGDLYVVVGNDVNVELLKGEGHPMFKQDERQYMVQAIRHVKQALISSGMGWMDAEPQIAIVKPDIYAVNHDGDKPEKRAFCTAHGLEYVVLKRLPKEGLTRRSSTDLRGF